MADWSMESTTLIWAAVLMVVGLVFLHFFREWKASKKELVAKNIDQQIAKEELKDAKRAGKIKKGDFIVLTGDRAHNQVKLGKIVGFLPMHDFTTFFYKESAWSLNILDV